MTASGAGSEETPESEARAPKTRAGERVAPLLFALLLLLAGLAAVQSLGALRANQYLEQGFWNLAALVVSQQIEAAAARVLQLASLLLALALSFWIVTRSTSPQSTLGAGIRTLQRGIDAILRRSVGRLPLQLLNLASAALIGGVYLYTSSLPPSPSGPNVLLIVMDTVRKSNLSIYGHSRTTTPNIDRFSENALVFDNAFAIGPWTIPNHASIFTGLYPSQHGATQESKFLPAAALTLAERLTEHGYDTAGFANNVNVAAKKGFAQGFRHYLDLFRARVRGSYEQGSEIPDGDAGAFATRRAVLAWLDDRSSRDRPFFVFINYMEAHSPYLPAERLAREYIEQSEERSPRISKYDYVDFLAGGYGLSEEEFRLSEALYDAEIRYLDGQIGELLAELEDREALTDTLVIITSDHGESFGEHQLVGHQFGLYDTVLRVPLIVRLPRSLALGDPERRSPSWVDLPDLFATILEVTGAPRLERDRNVGTSVHDQTASRNIFGPGERSEAIAEYYRPLKYLRKLAKRYPDFDRSRYDRRIRTLRRGPYKLIWSSDGRHELYDTDEDPGELRDLATRDATKLSKLAARLERWVETRSVSRDAALAEVEPELDPEMRAELKALGYLE